MALRVKPARKKNLLSCLLTRLQSRLARQDAWTTANMVCMIIKWGRTATEMSASVSRKDLGNLRLRVCVCVCVFSRCLRALNQRGPLVVTWRRIWPTLMKKMRNCSRSSCSSSAVLFRWRHSTSSIPSLDPASWVSSLTWWNMDFFDLGVMTVRAW